MSDRFTPYAGALTALAVFVCGGACAAETLQPNDQPPQLRSEPSPARYIHCATPIGDGPCGLDPAMQRLNVESLLDRRDDAPASERPNARPSR